MVLCFSPVGTTLRVRSRKFPAITNCTAIDWFHEWPEEALVSVSKRFLEETEQVPVGYDFFSKKLLTLLGDFTLYLLLQSIITVKF